MANKQVLQIKDFSGGVNSYSDPRDLQENEFQILDNAAVDEQGIIRVSGGLELKNNVNLNYNENSLLSKPGTGLFFFLSDKNIGAYTTINSDLNMAAADSTDAWGIEESNGGGTWNFEQTFTNTNANSILEYNPPTMIAQFGLTWGVESSFAATNHLTYAAKTNYSHGSLSYKSLNLLPGHEYDIIIKCASETPWFYLGSNVPPRLRLYNETLGKYLYPDMGFKSTSDETQSALLNDNISNLLDAPTAVVGNGSGTSASLTWSSAAQGDGSWTASNDTAAHKVERVQVTSFTDNTCDTTSGDATVACNSSSTIAVGQHVTGVGIPDDTFVLSVNSAGSVTSMELTQNATATGTNVTLTFYTPYNHKNFNAFFGGTSTSSDADNGFCLKLTSSNAGQGPFAAGNYMKSHEITVTENTTYLYDAFFHGSGDAQDVGGESVGIKIYDETNNADISNSIAIAESGPKWKHVNEVDSFEGVAPKSVEFTTPNNCVSIRILVGVKNDNSGPADFAYFAGFNLRKKVLELTYLDGYTGFLSNNISIHHPNSWNNENNGSVRDSTYLKYNLWINEIASWWRRYRLKVNIPADYDERNDWVLSLDTGIWGGVNQTGVSSFIVDSVLLIDNTSLEDVGQYEGKIEQRTGNMIISDYIDGHTSLSLYTSNADNEYGISNVSLPSVNKKTNFNFLNHGSKLYFCDSNFYNKSLYSLKEIKGNTIIKRESFEGPSIDLFTTDNLIGGVDYSYSYDGLQGYIEDETSPEYNDAYLDIQSSGFTGTTEVDKFQEYSGVSTVTINDADAADGSGIDTDLEGDEGDSVLKGFKYKQSGFVDDTHPYTKYIVLRNDNFSNADGGTDTSKMKYESRIAKVDIQLKHEIWNGVYEFDYQNYIPEMTVYLDVISSTAADTTKYAIPTDTTNFIKNIGSITINPSFWSLSQYENEYTETANTNDSIFGIPYNKIDGWSLAYNSTGGGFGGGGGLDDAEIWIYEKYDYSSKSYNVSINVPYSEIQGASNNPVLVHDGGDGVNLQLRFVPNIKEESAYWYKGGPQDPSHSTHPFGGNAIYGYEWGGIAGEKFEIKKIELFSYITTQSSNTEDLFFLSSADSVQANIAFETPVEGEADGWDDQWDLYLTSVNEEGIESAIGESAAKGVSNTDVTKSPRIDIVTGDFNPNFAASKFIKGYMTSKRNGSYNLQFIIDCKKRTIRSSSSMKEFPATAAGSVIQYSLPSSHLLLPNEIDSYESETGVLIENATNPNKMIASFKTAVVANNTLYAGNVYQDGENYPDRMLKSPLGKAPLLPSTNFIDVAINDGDEIISLQFYKDRLLQFKKNKLFIISTSEDYEYLQDTIENVGISQESQVIRTPYGIAWINERGCYLYDGTKVNNLTDGKLAYKSWKDSESSWEIDGKYSPSIHYLRKEDKLIVYGATDSLDNIGENEGTGGGTAYIPPVGNNLEITIGGRYINKQYLRKIGYQYDFQTKSWILLTNYTEESSSLNEDIIDGNLDGRLRVPSHSDMVTNFAYDENGDSIFIIKPTNRIVKWDDNPKQTMGYIDKSEILTSTSDQANLHRDFRVITKDYDFGAPSIKKKIHKVYVTFKSTDLESHKKRKLIQNQDYYSPSHVGVYYAINGKNTWTEFSETKSDNYGAKGLTLTKAETLTTLSSSVLYTETTISVASASNIKVGDVLSISPATGWTVTDFEKKQEYIKEQMLVTSVSGTTIGVRRNYNSTIGEMGDSGVIHPSGRKVYISTGDWIVAELKPSSSINNIDSFKLRFSTKKITDATEDENGVPPGFMINDISVIYRTKNVR